MSDEPQGTNEGAAAPPPAAEAPPAAPPPAAGGIDTDDTGKMLAALGYLIWIIALVLILIDPYKNQRFVRHHAVQALALAVLSFVASVVMAIPIIGWIVGGIAYIGVFVFAILGLVKTFQGEYWEMPLVYGMVEQYI
jgi:uncharacterized membrane protein